MLRRLLLAPALLLLMPLAAWAQLPADAVILDKVKISEKQKAIDLDPVTLEASDPAGVTWEHKGVTYRGKAESKATFEKDPEKYAKAAEKQRYINNFCTAMCTVWCPVTDEVTPGGMTQWKRGEYTFESCCSFCDESYTEENFVDGLKKLKERAAQAYGLVGAKYTEGAKSPVEGAIKTE